MMCPVLVKSPTARRAAIFSAACTHVISFAKRTFHVLSQPDIAWINDPGGVPGLLQGRILR